MRMRIFMTALLVFIAVAGSALLAGCSSTPQGTQGMIGGRGPDYNAHS
jgi:predicted small secreted protein